MSLPSQNIAEVVCKGFVIPDSVQVGDFLVARYEESQWSRYLPWEEWDHVALVSQIDPLKIIEVTGIVLQEKCDDKEDVKEDVKEGVVEYEIGKPRSVKLFDGTTNKNGNLWLLDDLLEVRWLRPVFPDPIRGVDKWYVPWGKRDVISEEEARIRAVEYAKSQLGEPYSILASKWSESNWYCSLLIYKSYSRSVTGMYLETYGRARDLRAGPMVTPEDLVDSPRSETYFIWKKEN